MIGENRMWRFNFRFGDSHHATIKHHPATAGIFLVSKKIREIENFPSKKLEKIKKIVKLQTLDDDEN